MIILISTKVYNITCILLDIYRYDYGGQPLPMVSLSQTPIPKCSSCGSSRVFEMQLMPALLQCLTTDGHQSVVDAGTVFIYTCAKNCYNSAVVEESVTVQHDPDEHLLSKYDNK